MPPASSRRAGPSRRTRRIASEDNIEEATNPSQSQREDVDDADQTMNDDEDEAPRRRGARAQVAKSSQAGPSTRKDADADETVEEVQDEDDDEDDELIDVDNFGEQPLDREHAKQIPAFGGDWEAIYKSIGRNAPAMATDVAAAFADVGGEHVERHIEAMDGIIRDIVDMEEEMSVHQEVLRSINNRIARGEVVVDVPNMYKREVKEQKDAYKAKTTRQKYARNARYIAFRERIFEVQNEGEAMPPVADLLAQEDGDESEDDDDVQVGGQTQDFKCPLTLQPLVNPMTCAKCKHSFSGAAIKEYLGGRPGVAKKCPASGCSKMITMSDLKEDAALQKRVRDAVRRERRRAEEEDDGEVIE